MTAHCSPHVSVIVPTRNGLPLVERCLRMVLAQETPWPFEVVVIDSESTDGTWELATSLPITAVRIPVCEFNHGGTRNRAARLAKGRYLVWLVQDAVPADSHWLRRLVEAAEPDGVAGSYSLQLPHPDDSPFVRFLVEATMPRADRPTEQRLAAAESWKILSPDVQFRLSTFHNNSSCMKRDVWHQHPFQPLPYGEDLDWGSRVIQNGYTIIFEPRSCVYHSHDRSAWYELKRAYADHELVVRLFDYVMYPSLLRLPFILVKMSLARTRFILRQPDSASAKVRSLLQGAMVTTARLAGASLGARSAKLTDLTRAGPLWRRVDAVLRHGV